MSKKIKKTIPLSPPDIGGLGDFKKSGFSLIELLTVITIIGILSSIAVPSYMKFYRQTNLKNAVGELKSGLNEAFSHARSHSETVIVTGAEDAQTFLVESCETKDCINKKSVEGFENITFKGKVFLKTTFEIKFLAPFGNIDYDKNRADNPNEVELEIKLENQDASQSLKIYKKSGLVETLKYTPK